jgi:cytochrome P450
MTLQADFTSQDFFRNPAAAIENLRRMGPVVEVRFPIIGKVWATTTQALADQVLKDTDIFTIRREDGNVAGLQWWMPGIVRTMANSMLSMDEPDPERLDLQRRPNRHIAFGTGIHFCLGHQLARIEGRCALKSLLRRWPQLALAVDPSEIKWRKRPGLRAIDRLPVVAVAASTRAERDKARVA